MQLRKSFFLAALALAGAAQAQLTVSEPWVRGTVATQKVTGAFMTLSSASDAKLLEVRSPVAGLVEIHEMAMQGNTMQMRALKDGLALPAGKAVELKPGSYHVMLMDLKQPIKAGDTVPLTLTLVGEGADKQRQTLEVKATVKALGAQSMPMPMQEHMHKH